MIRGACRSIVLTAIGSPGCLVEEEDVPMENKVLIAVDLSENSLKSSG